MAPHGGANSTATCYLPIWSAARAACGSTGSCTASSPPRRRACGFFAEPERALQGASEEEKDMLQRLDWKALQDSGASFFCLVKLARTKGVSNREMVATFRGETLEQFLKTHGVPAAR